MEEKTQNQVLKEISDYLKSAYLSENSLLSSNLTEAQLHMIELTSEICAKGTHPILILSSTSYEDLMGITGLNFNKILLDTAKSIISEYPINTSTQEPKVDSVNTNKTIACVSYSCGKSLSKDYEFANTVEFATCSNKEINGMYCIAANQQYRCPMYKQDSQTFASYELTYAEDTYTYSVDRYRHVHGHTLFAIYDQNRNLLNQLTFDPETYSTISKEDFNLELKSIVNKIHKNLFYKNEFSLIDSTVEETQNIDLPKSYIATLIS
jgi:hypothetical protein